VKTCHQRQLFAKVAATGNKATNPYTPPGRQQGPLRQPPQTAEQTPPRRPRSHTPRTTPGGLPRSGLCVHHTDQPAAQPAHRLHRVEAAARTGGSARTKTARRPAHGRHRVINTAADPRPNRDGDHGMVQHNNGRAVPAHHRGHPARRREQRRWTPVEARRTTRSGCRRRRYGRPRTGGLTKQMQPEMQPNARTPINADVDDRRSGWWMAVAVGFEPTEGVNPHALSRFATR
jgi:hypothetical protein